MITIMQAPLAAWHEMSIAETLAHMANVAKQASADPAIQRIAEQLDGATTHDYVMRAFWWVRQHIPYVRDEDRLESLGLPPDAELIVRPELLVRTEMGGDCDDHATITAALLLARNIPVRFITITTPEDPAHFTHVWVEALTQNGWVALDTAYGVEPGWVAPTAVRRAVWPVLVH